GSAGKCAQELSKSGQTLEKFPTLTASRLYVMVRERGYLGGPDHFRHLISLHQPRPEAEAYLRLSTLPGEQGQVDWGLCRDRHRPHNAESRIMPSQRLAEGQRPLRCRLLVVSGRGGSA
ncbi:MAG: hypothetical protein WCF44_09870, partial [Candidatus Methylophosphatis roskildensis]